MKATRQWMPLVAALCAVVGGSITAGSGLASAAELPEGRVYELVTPPEGYDTEVYPTGDGSTADETEFPYQAAADGNAVVFPGGPTVGGNENSGFHGGNQYLASRSPAGGWSEVNLSPDDRPSVAIQAFNNDLSEAFLDGVEPLTPSSPGFGEEPEPFWMGNYDVLYSTSTKTTQYTPLFTVKPPYRAPAGLRTVGEIRKPSFPPTSGYREGRMLAFAGASADDSHLLFLANDALAPGAEGGLASSFEEANNLYESFDGALRLVNVLPDGSTHVNATFGGGPLFSHVISSDGSRIFWTDLSTGHIYMRENGSRTVEVSPAGKFQTASSDGTMAFFTNGDLYEYDVTHSITTDLDPGVPVRRVLGASEAGKYIYFTTESGELDLWHEGHVTSIATVDAEGPAEVTPDGHALVFHELRQLPSFQTLSEVMVYEADANELYCVSCGSGEGSGELIPSNKFNVYQPRWISADGARVFFESRVPLVPEDSNGKLDAYEWTKPGSNGCAESHGCIHLLTSGTSSDVSHFADASVSGDDAFVVTRAKLVPADNNELYDLYDLRVNGYQPIAPPTCTGTGCQGLPGAPPIFATPSSVTFEGVGNFATSKGKTAAKPKKTQKKKHKKKHKPKRKAKAKKKSKRSAAARRHVKAKGGRS
jgi:hypothetical protein